MLGTRRCCHDFAWKASVSRDSTPAAYLMARNTRLPPEFRRLGHVTPSGWDPDAKEHPDGLFYPVLHLPPPSASPLVSLLGSPLLAFIGVVMSVVIFSFLLLFLLCWICVSVQRWRKSRRGGGVIVPSPPRHPIDTNGKIDVNWVLVADTPKPTNLS